jgi:hypothetical protein
VNVLDDVGFAPIAADRYQEWQPPRGEPTDDLDPRVYNLLTAFWHGLHGEWRATKHGCGRRVFIEQCAASTGCTTCTAALTKYASRPPVQQTSPARDRAVELVRSARAAGATVAALAAACGVSKGSISELSSAGGGTVGPEPCAKVVVALDPDAATNPLPNGPAAASVADIRPAQTRWGDRGSNPGPTDYESAALTI